MEAHTADETIVSYGRSSGEPSRPELVSHPILAAVRRAGTSHIYADTADVEELASLITASAGKIYEEIDGNTANQPLVHKVIDRYLRQNDVGKWAQELRKQSPDISKNELNILLYAIICGRVGNDVGHAFAAGRSWEVSLQLHMALGGDAEASKRVGRQIRRMVPGAFVKVPFTPHAPHCFLIARDLEREGIPVNFTSTFSARQAVAAGLLADVTRTNIFMGRINQGLKANLLAEHVGLEAQRALIKLRRDAGVKTQLIVASVREWETFVKVAGCDVFTAPCDAIRGFLEQKDYAPEEVRSQLETSYEDELGVSREVNRKLGPMGAARLYEVEPELIEFMTDLRKSSEYASMNDGEQLYKRFDEAGFADLFHAPHDAEWVELRQSKLPKLESTLTQRLPIDTLYSLLADSDFEKSQDEMDEKIQKRIG